MSLSQAVTVFGAYGHTGRFVVSELQRRGWKPILSGRDASQLNTVSGLNPGSEVCVATVEDPKSLDRALAGASAVINCGGPFLDMATPIVEAALRARIHYLDLAAEQKSVLSLFERFANPTSAARVLIIPAMAFYGGLGDLLATAAVGDWDYADEINIATALDSWNPTRGTRETGQRNHGQRFTFSNNTLQLGESPPPRNWNFPPPFGLQEVEGVLLSETITVSRHLQASEIRAYLNRRSLQDVRNPDTPPPVAADESGPSSQVFVMDVIARKGDSVRRALARGRDIYAITAPIVVEAMERAFSGPIRAAGVRTAGEAFNAPDFLRALSPSHLFFELQTES